MTKYKFYSLWLSFVMIIIFIFQLIIPNFTETFLLNQKAFPQIYRLITSIFLHTSLQHLIFNLFALVFFGLILEKLIGSNKFLIVFFSSGIFANLISLNFYPSSLGASGAIFGIIGTLTMIKPLMSVWAFSMPMPLFLASTLWALGDILGIFLPSNIANLAHLSGLAIGLIFGLIFRIRKQEKESLGYSYRTEIPETQIREWENKFMR